MANTFKDHISRFIPSSAWGFFRERKNDLLLSLRGPIEAIGYSVTLKNDYYSPLVPVTRLRQNVDRSARPSSLEGVAYDIERMKRTLSELLTRYLDEFLTLPSYRELQS